MELHRPYYISSPSELLWNLENFSLTNPANIPKLIWRAFFPKTTSSHPDINYARNQPASDLSFGQQDSNQRWQHLYDPDKVDFAGWLRHNGTWQGIGNVAGTRC